MGKKERFNAKRIGRWAGGYVRSTRSGRKAYVIERWHKGRRFHVATGTSSREAALLEFRRFELDPEGYIPGGTQPGGPLLLDSGLILKYREHQLTAGLTTEWANEVARCLKEWMRALAGRDLRALTLHQDLRVALDGWATRRPHRIKAIKGLFRWLRQERGLVGRNEDATLDLRVPPARPEKQRRRKIVPPEDVAEVLKRLPPGSRDILHLLTATGWHISEVRKFAESGEIVQPLRAEGVMAVLITRHKSGDLVKTPILYKEHLEAARRIRSIRRFPERATIARHMRTACAAAGVPWFGMGQMRHSVITWGVRDGGATVEQAKEFANHRSETTTKRFYLDLDIPKSAIPVYRLLDEA